MPLVRSFAGPALAVALVLLAPGCRSSSNSVPAFNNAPAPAAVPLTLSGQVVDAGTSLPVPGATVRVTSTSGTALATLTTDAAGAYNLDVSGLSDPQVNVSATASGYGHAAAVANLDAANNTTDLPTLSLTGLAATPVNATPAGASVTTANSSEAENGLPVTIGIPSGAVAAPTALTLSALPVDQVPLIPNPDTQILLAAFDIGPDTAAFAVDAQVTLPLPGTFTAGEPFSVMRLDSATGQWVALPRTATVNPGGLTATVAIATGGTFGLVVSGFTTTVAAAAAPALAGLPGDSPEASAPLAVPPAPPAPVVLTGGSKTVAGVCIRTVVFTQTGTLPLRLTFINNWIAGCNRTVSLGSRPTTTTVVFPNLRALHLVDSAGRQIPPAGAPTPGYYIYTVTFAYVTRPASSITLAGGPPRYPSAWSITATTTTTSLTQSGVLTWQALTGATGGV